MNTIGASRRSLFTLTLMFIAAGPGCVTTPATVVQEAPVVADIWSDETPSQGVLYLSGDVERPGTYNLPVSGRLRLERLIVASGGPLEKIGQLYVSVARSLPNGEVEHVTVPYSSLLSQGHKPAIFLKAGDVIIVQYIS